jgi:hypothetical protein
LFAVTSDGDLWWRAAGCIPSPLFTGSLLFYNSKEGKVSIGQFDGNGDFRTEQYYPDPANGHESFEKNWTHIVPGKNSLFFFYNSANGKGLAGDVTISGIYKNLQTYLENTFALGWTNIVSCTKR